MIAADFSIRRAPPNSAKELCLPDARYGYDVVGVESAFEAWGPEGRAAFSLWQLVDVVCLLPAYALVLTALLNHTAAALRR
jgi:hypothetical protein